MKKKLTSLFLAVLLALSLISTALAAPLPPTDPEPEITPIVTLQPGEPEEPGIDPQCDDPLPNPPPPPFLDPLD